MTEIREFDAQAAEYVLGTLPPCERAAMAARCRRDPALATAIADWGARLAPLTEMVQPVTPPGGLAGIISAAAGGVANASGKAICDVRAPATKTVFLNWAE